MRSRLTFAPVAAIGDHIQLDAAGNPGIGGESATAASKWWTVGWLSTTLSVMWLKQPR